MLYARINIRAFWFSVMGNPQIIFEHFIQLKPDGYYSA